MVNLISYSHGVRQGRGIVWGMAALVGIGMALWQVDGFALPSAIDTSEQALVVSSATVRTPHEKLVRGEEALARYAHTGDRAALTEARDHLLDVSAHFSQSALQKGRFDTEEIITFARFSNLMSRYTGEEALHHRAQEALSLLTGRERALTRGAQRSLQQAEEELHTSPLHITVVGSKNDKGAKMLWSEAVRVKESYVRREWWDRSEGALPNPDVRYPKLAAPAAFVCVDTRCSVPLYTDQELREKLAQMEMAK